MISNDVLARAQGVAERRARQVRHGADLPGDFGIRASEWPRVLAELQELRRCERWARVACLVVGLLVGVVLGVLL